jgi:RNA polymerase sigma factor (sigma-70 family)
MRTLRWDRKEWRKLLRRVRFATRGSDDAEDLLHAAYLRLSEYGRSAEIQNPEAFLVRTARNIAADEARHRRVRNELDNGAEILIETTDHEPLQSEALAARERLRRVEEGLDRLGPRTREIFLMHRVDGLKYKDIARHVGISVSAVEKHVAKASLFLAGWVEGW